MQYLLRLVIAAILYLALIQILPAALHLFGVTINGDLFLILRVVGGLAALYYIVWGPPFPTPGAP